MKNRNLFEVFHEIGITSSDKCIEAGVAFILNKLHLKDDEVTIFFPIVTKVFWACRKKWTSGKVKRYYPKMLLNFSEWLDLPLDMPAALETTSALDKMDVDDPLEGTSTQRGRKKSFFEEIHSPARRKRVASLTSDDSYSANELAYASQIKMRKEGRSGEAKTIKESIGLKHHIRHLRSYTPDEALAFLIKTDMTKEAYQEARQGALDHGFDLYPPYNLVREAKEGCFPSNINVTDKGAEVPIQSLLNHTVTRLCEFKSQDITEHLSKALTDSLLLTSTYGFDGASGQALYKQRSDFSDFDDSAIFIASLVPLKLTTNSGNKVIWNNERPNSTLFCRPIRFVFEKENIETTDALFKNLNSQIQKL